jgi:hypothetical protein
MAQPTLDDAIAVLAKQAGTTPDSFHIAEFLVDFGSYGQGTMPRAVPFREDPQVIREAQGLLRILDQVEKMSRRLKKLPHRHPARPSAPTA